jgi:prophage antirepressor-like protein
MAELKVYNFNNKDYYLSEDVYNLEPISFIGCSKSTRSIIKNKKLNEKDYIFMKYIKSKNEWLISEDKYKSAKLFLTKEWTTNNLVIFKKDDDKTEEDLKIESLKAPPILNITDNEKFVDIDGNKLDIEIRGTRNINDIYFKVKDVSDKFKLSNIKTILLNKDSSFKKKLHYKLFKMPKVIEPDSKPIKKNQKLLFLTFKGLTKLLYVSHSKNAEHFQDWINNIIYIHKFGTKEEKQKLFDKVLGNDIESSRNAIKCNTNKISSIYLLTLGYVKDLRKEMNISDNFSDEDIVCKYGFTDNLDRRLMEHKNNFSKIENVDLKLKYYTFIDTNELSKAENNMKNIFNFNNSIIQYQDYKELVVLSKKNLEYIKEEYEKCRRLFNGNQEDNLKHIDFLKNQIDKLTLQLIIKDKDIENLQEKLNNEIKNREIEIKNIIRDYKHQLNNKDKDNYIELTQYKHQIEILNKDIENLKLKITRKTK